MSHLRPELPPLPARLRNLPVDERGYPVPWFVAWVDGKPEFRAMDGKKLHEAITWRRCWTCGGQMGRYGTFVIGPMCAVNRTSAEPPSHRECADFSVKGCPFLSRPDMRRRETDLPEGHSAGVMIKRNPGVILLWVSRDWQPWNAGNGVLIDIGEPVEVSWWREGRAATRAEVLESIESGLPLIQGMAEKDPDPAAALAELAQRKAQAMALVPP